MATSPLSPATAAQRAQRRDHSDGSSSWSTRPRSERASSRGTSATPPRCRASAPATRRTSRRASLGPPTSLRLRHDLSGLDVAPGTRRRQDDVLGRRVVLQGPADLVDRCGPDLLDRHDSESRGGGWPDDGQARLAADRKVQDEIAVSLMDTPVDRLHPTVRSVRRHVQLEPRCREGGPRRLRCGQDARARARSRGR